MKTLLKGGVIVSPRGCYESDIIIDGEKIVKIGKNLPSDGCKV